MTHSDGNNTVREHIIERTHGEPPQRECLPGPDDKWDGYQLGVEEAICAAEEWLLQARGGNSQ